MTSHVSLRIGAGMTGSTQKGSPVHGTEEAEQAVSVKSINWPVLKVHSNSRTNKQSVQNQSIKWNGQPFHLFHEKHFLSITFVLISPQPLVEKLETTETTRRSCCFHLTCAESSLARTKKQINSHFKINQWNEIIVNLFTCSKRNTAPEEAWDNRKRDRRI